jgi:alpha-tubulin suppressor-like RCC1 family protein
MVLLLTLTQTACGSSSVTSTIRTLVAAGGSHVLALKPDGSVWAWGWNDTKQLGDVSIIGSEVPIAVKGLPSKAIGIAAGDDFSLALESDGSVWAWGHNDRGQLGNGTNVQSGKPARVKGLTGKFVAIAAGWFFALALRSDGTVWGWGFDYAGQLGNGSNDDTTSAVEVTGLKGRVVSIACGFSHSLAVMSDGSVWAWGDNGSGELGVKTQDVFQNTPVRVDGLGSGVTAVAGGTDQSLALKADGSVWSWGVIRMPASGGSFGSESPTPVAGIEGAKAIGAGWDLDVVLESNGSVWSWGENLGDFGSGAGGDSITPVQATGVPAGVTTIAVKYADVYAITASGSVWAWGSNNHGELGNDTIDPEGGSLVPVRVKGF